MKADSNTQNGFMSKTKPGVKKRLVSEQSSQSVEDMESEIDDLKSQLEGRDDEVKVGKIYLDLAVTKWNGNELWSNWKIEEENKLTQ